MGLASEIERHFIRTRTRQSLAIRKELIDKQGYFLNKKGILTALDWISF
jgi:DNA invertase Pin-like site-specific DNA recombinase